MATLPPSAGPADTLFGVCAAIGEATGLPPTLARLGFVASLLAISLEGTIIAYLILALAFVVAEPSTGHRR